MRSDEARRDSLLAEVTGLLETAGDPLAFARLRLEQVSTRKHTTSGRLQTKGLSCRISFAKLPFHLDGRARGHDNPTPGRARKRTPNTRHGSGDA
jgi:hypothetical protein